MISFERAVGPCDMQTVCINNFDLTGEKCVGPRELGNHLTSMELWRCAGHSVLPPCWTTGSGR